MFTESVAQRVQSSCPRPPSVGSGKSPLVQWFTVTIAEHRPSSSLLYLVGRVPFVLPLRALTRAGVGELPAPQDFLSAVNCPHNPLVFRKARQHGGNIQALATPTGFPVWVSDVEPGSVHDVTAAREHVPGALYWAAAQLALPTLADNGYDEVGMGVFTPAKVGEITSLRQLRLSATER